jgi:outer membrane protein TolC
MKQILLCCFLLASSLFAAAQQTLSLEAYLNIVKKYHPVSKEAALSVEIAKAEVLSARGAFDPRLENNISRKEFEGLLYYDHQISELKVPTWYGVELVAGLESLTGQRTSTPDTKGNTSYFGFSVPVAKGLLMDSRRATLQQAKIFQQLSLQEQKSLLNDLLYNATKAYWNWWQYYQIQLVFQQAIINAKQRFQFVKTAFHIGERPAIDTLEALAQLQSMEIRASEVQVEINNTLLDVNTFLWQENGEAYTMPPTVIPDTTMPDLLTETTLEQLLLHTKTHPDLQQYRFKSESLQVEKKLKFQSLLPSVYLKYHQLNKSHSLEKTFNTPWLENNYRYGVAVTVPLRLSEGRGEYRQVKLKILQTELQRVNKQLLQQTKVQQYYNEWKQLQQQILMQHQALKSYISLQKGEEIKFTNGESTLFLVNAREMKVLEAHQKLIELQGKEQKVAISVLWATGTLPVQ